MLRASPSLSVRFKHLLEDLGFKLNPKSGSYIRQTPVSNDSLTFLVSHKFAFNQQLSIYLESRLNAVEELFQKIPNFNRPKNIWTIYQSSLNMNPKGAWNFDKRNIESVDEDKVSTFISENCLEWFHQTQNLENVRDLLLLEKLGDVQSEWKSLLIVLLLLKDKNGLNNFLSKARSYIESTDPFFFGDEFSTAYNLIRNLDSDFFPEFAVDLFCVKQTKSRLIANEKSDFDQLIRTTLNGSTPLYSTPWHVFLILGDPNYSPIWTYEAWNEIMNLIRPLLLLLPSSPKIGTVPSIHDSKIFSTKILSVPEFGAGQRAPKFFLALENQLAVHKDIRFNPAILRVRSVC